MARRLLGEDPEAAVCGAVQGDPLGQHVAAGEAVELADELAGLQVEDRVALLELVQLFEDGNGDGDVVFLEVEDGVEVVEDDRGVEDKDFGQSSLHSLSWGAQGAKGGYEGRSLHGIRRHPAADHRVTPTQPGSKPPARHRRGKVAQSVRGSPR
jgi:hypothetical protein